VKRKFLSLILAAAMVLSLCGCGETAGQIAGSVMDAAMNELKNQMVQLLEKNKLEVVEAKTAFGQLNDDGGKYQFFIAALVKSNSTTVPQSTADTMDKIFSDAGLTYQTSSVLENSHLVHKDITFKHADYSAGNYYVIWGYAADLTVELPDLSQLIEATTAK
jgi:hypothetical protein